MSEESEYDNLLISYQYHMLCLPNFPLAKMMPLSDAWFLRPLFTKADLPTVCVSVCRVIINLSNISTQTFVI